MKSKECTSTFHSEHKILRDEQKLNFILKVADERGHREFTLSPSAVLIFHLDPLWV